VSGVSVTDDFLARATSLAKQDLGMMGATATSREEYLSALVAVAVAEVERYGVTLAEDVEAEMLIANYAAELFRGRAMPDRYSTAESRAPMPRNIMWRVQNMLFAQKARAEGGE
jgi:hypothetical protein